MSEAGQWDIVPIIGAVLPTMGQLESSYNENDLVGTALYIL